MSGRHNRPNAGSTAGGRGNEPSEWLYYRLRSLALSDLLKLAGRCTVPVVAILWDRGRRPRQGTPLPRLGPGTPIGVALVQPGPEEALPLQAHGEIEQRREHLRHPSGPSAMSCSMRAATIVSWVCDIEQFPSRSLQVLGHVGSIQLLCNLGAYMSMPRSTACGVIAVAWISNCACIAKIFSHIRITFLVSG